MARCDLCLSSCDITQQCPQLVDADPDLPSRLKAVESAVLSLSHSRGSGAYPARLPRGGDVCRLFNKNACKFKRCKYQHTCSKCGGDHAAVDCSAGNGSLEVPLRPSPRVGLRDSARLGSARPY